MLGSKFGRLVVTSLVEGGKCVCLCECGAVLTTYRRYLKQGMKKSCGCLRIDACKTGNSRRTHGMRTSPTYKSWQKMKERCSNPNSNRYEYYGGKGISYDSSWDIFENFLADMGERPLGTTLGRADNSLPYSKANCLWATSIEQANNKTNSHVVTHGGESFTVAQWSKKTGIPYGTLLRRLNYHKWSPCKALTTPIKSKSS